jgi:hypothetical protein
VILAIGGLFAQTPARADGFCQPSPIYTAAMMPLTAVGVEGQAGYNLLIAATLSLEIGKIDAPKALAAVEPCNMGKMDIDGRSWTVTGGDRAFVRRVVSPNELSPVASIYPFVDLLAALRSSRDHTAAPPTRYLLITSFGSVDTLWNAYATIPSDAQLSKDLDAAITGRASPAASVDVSTKKVNVFLSKPSG